MMRRRNLACFLALLALAVAGPAESADYPNRTVHLLVGFAPGGGTDVLARVIAQQLTQKWGKSVVVENRPGATGRIAADLVANAAADGYTILMVNNSFTINPGDGKPGFDPAKAFTPIIRPAMTPDVLVINPTMLKVHTVKEMLAIAKADPQRLFYGTPGDLSPPNMEMELLKMMADVNITHVPYSGSGPAMVGVIKGDIQMTFASIQGSLGSIEAGTLQALAISTAFRSPRLPDVPTVAESGEITGYDGGGAWYGVLGPAKLPPDVLAKIHDDIVTVIKSAEVQKTLSDQGFIVIADSPEEFTQFIHKDVSKWDDVLKAMHRK